MVIRNECQALCVAVEMEKRAIRMYERALMIAPEDVKVGIREILADEQEHLCRFQAMRTCYPMDAGEEKLLISSLAADVLFPGGVMEMNREGALSALEELFRYAAESEERAVETYADFANRCEDESVRQAFMAIVAEESGHLAVMRLRIKK